jgi:hypothetical protein
LEYDRQNDEFVNLQAVTMANVDAKASESRMGESVDICSDFSVCGVLHEVNGTTPGAAFVFMHNNKGEWEIIQRLHGSYSDDRKDGYGQSVVISGSTIAVGAPTNGFNTLSGRREPGAVYIYELMGESYEETAFLEGSLGSKLGTSVSIYYRNLLVGTPGDEKGVMFEKYDPADINPGIILYLLN